MGGYCAVLNSILWDADQCRAAFEECAEIIRLAITNKGLSLARDNAKVREVTEEIKRVAISRKPPLCASPALS